MIEFLAKLFDTEGFPPRWNCGTWTSGHGWLHILSDLAVFGAYVAIPCLLVYFMRKRRDLAYPPVFWLFSAFIFACGATHLIEATIFWNPWYRLSGVAKLLTAIASWLTVIALIPLIPKALALPKLALVNRELEVELEEHKRIEEELRVQSEELERHTRELESFSAGMVAREERVIELKREVDEILREHGKPARYAPMIS